MTTATAALRSAIPVIELGPRAAGALGLVESPTLSPEEMWGLAGLVQHAANAIELGSRPGLLVDALRQADADLRGRAALADLHSVIRRAA